LFIFSFYIDTDRFLEVDRCLEEVLPYFPLLAVERHDKHNLVLSGLSPTSSKPDKKNMKGRE
jgi:hypothetical protein